MKRISIYCAILIAFFFACKNEDPKMSYPEFYKNFNEIAAFIYNDQIEEAIVKFENIATRIPHVPSSYYFGMARACAEKGKCSQAAKYLEKSLVNGQEYGKGVGMHKTIDLCEDEINNVLIKEEEIHKEHFNFEYKALIDSMIVIDQRAMSESDYERARTVISQNMATLLSNIERYGYPSEMLIGHKSAFSAFILILHSDIDKENEIFSPILWKAFENGQIWPKGLAWIIDRRRVSSEDKLEPYYYHLSSEKYYDLTAEQMEEVNRRRDSIGLKPK